MDGKLPWEHLSASQVQLFQLCPRKWWLNKIAGIPDSAPTAALELGSEVHARIEKYLLGGGDTMGPIERAGFHFLPKPLSLGIEHEISDFALEGVPVRGRIDGWNASGEWIDDEGETRPMSPNTTEIIDWKTTSNLQYAKNASQLAVNPQMLIYAKYALKLLPELNNVRLSHGSFQTARGRGALKTSTVCSREQVEVNYDQHVKLSILGMKEASTAKSELEVTPNFSSCRAFNRPCPYMATCHGKNLGLRLLGITDTRINNIPKPTPGELTVSILDNLQTPDKATSAAAPVGVAPPDAPAPDPVLATSGQDGQMHEQGGGFYVFSKGRWEMLGGSALKKAQDSTALETVPAPAPKRGQGRPRKEAPVIVTPQEFIPAAGYVLMFGVIGGPPSLPLEPIIDGAAKQIADAIDKGVDIRCSKHAALDFGRWKGVLAAHLRESPPPPGVYSMFARGDLYQTGFEALVTGAASVYRGAL